MDHEITELALERTQKHVVQFPFFPIQMRKQSLREIAKGHSWNKWEKDPTPEWEPFPLCQEREVVKSSVPGLVLFTFLTDDLNKDLESNSLEDLLKNQRKYPGEEKGRRDSCSQVFEGLWCGRGSRFCLLSISRPSYTQIGYNFQSGKFKSDVRRNILKEMYESEIGCLERLWIPSNWRSSNTVRMNSCQVCYNVDFCMGWTKRSVMSFPTLAFWNFYKILALYWKNINNSNLNYYK